MSPHVHEQHVLSLERPLLPHAPRPVTDKVFPTVSVDVVVVDVLHEVVQALTLLVAVQPPAVVVVPAPPR